MSTWFFTAKRTSPQGSFNTIYQRIVRLSLLVFLLLAIPAAHAAELRAISPLPTTKAGLSPELSQRDAYPHVAGQLLVRFKDGVSRVTAASAHAGVKAQTLKRFRSPGNLELVSLPANLPVERAIQLYRNNPDVLYTEPNYIIVAEVIPNDPLFSSQWNLQNTSSFPIDIDAPEAWNITTGTTRT